MNDIEKKLETENRLKGAITAAVADAMRTDKVITLEDVDRVLEEGHNKIQDIADDKAAKKKSGKGKKK